MADIDPPVRVERCGAFTRLRLDAPERKNALSLAMMDELASVLAQSAVDETCRGIIIDHTGTVFCAGVDLAERRSLPVGARDHSAALADLYRAVWAYPKPVLCRVDGAVRGGGIGLVALADLTVVSPRASFAFTEVRVGVAPALVGAIAMARLGATALAPWLLSGEVFSAQQAVDVGLATDLSDSDGEHAITAWTTALTKGAPSAQRLTKVLTRQFVGADVAVLIDEMLVISASQFESPEAAEGMAAFVEKRPPSWAPSH